MITWLFGKNKTKETLQAKEKDNFISLASHQLRTPLSVIKWYTEMLLDEDAGPLTEDQRKYLATIQTSNQQSIDLVRSLLNVSRLDLGTFCISPTSVSIPGVVDEVLGSFSEAITSKNLTIHKEYTRETTAIMSDQKMCLVIIKNLIANAVCFSKKGGEINILVKPVSRNQMCEGKSVLEDSVLFSVKDNGLGIPQKEQEKVFTKMFKGSNNKEDKSTGSGLGLYIVKTAASNIGGKVWFVSSLEEGSTFYVLLPQKGLRKKEGTTTLD